MKFNPYWSQALSNKPYVPKSLREPLPFFPLRSCSFSSGTGVWSGGWGSVVEGQGVGEVSELGKCLNFFLRPNFSIGRSDAWGQTPKAAKPLVDPSWLHTAHQEAASQFLVGYTAFTQKPTLLNSEASMRVSPLP